MNKIERKNWISSFSLIGAAVVNDYTFKIDEKSEKSNWKYNQLSLGVDCGEKHGVVYTEMMGGYDIEKNNVLYAHGKNDDNSDNFNEKITVDWDDRFNESILENIGDLSFITVGLEKTTKDKTFYKKFLSAYDAIAYIKQHLEDGMVINVKGNLRYSPYNNKIQVHKKITNITLSKIDDTSKYRANFTQSILLGKESIGDIDKSKGALIIAARVLDYVKEINGNEIKGQYPFNKNFEYEMDLSNSSLVQKVKDKLFKVRKDITQINFEGDFVEGGAVVTVTEDDIPDDIKTLIDIGAYTLKDALAKCSENGNREQRMILRKPVIRMIGEEGSKVPVVQKYEKQYKEEDLVIDIPDSDDNDNTDENSVSNDANTETSSISDMDWLNSL